MNNLETISQLESLRLRGMANYVRSLTEMSLQDRPTLEVAIARMAESELEDRNRRRTEMYLKTSKLRYDSVLENVECSTERNFTKDDLQSIADCGFIRRAENLLITGKTGCGKSYLACAIGRQACFLGLRVEYFSMNKFIERIALAKVDGSML